MLEQINLFPKTQAIWEKRMKMRRLVQVVSVVSLILYFILLSSLFSYALLLSREEKSVKEKIDHYGKRIRQLEPVESKQVFLKSKLKEIVEIFKTEEKPEGALDNLEAVSLEGISFSGINYADGKIKLDVRARDVLILDQFVKKLTDEGEKFFSLAEFGSLGRTREGIYDFSLLLKKRDQL